MKNLGFNNTKKKLTIIFTLLVFWIAVLLEWVFFSVKYYNYISEEEHKFALLTDTIEDKFTSIREFVINYDVWSRLYKMWRGNIFWINTHNNEDFVNLLIIDKAKRELIFSNVVDDLRLSFVESILDNEQYWIILQKNWYIVKKIKLSDRNVNYDVLFIKNLRYSFLDYLRDVLWFAWIMSLFSILFFYVWYKFVSKNLEPVERNIIDMHDFIHNAWHELKTPISIIHSNLQLIKETKNFDEELVIEWLNEINRLNHLIESLIELSNINSSEIREKVEVSDEIELVLKDFKAEADKKNIEILYSKKFNKKLIINRQYFYILFSNLLWNAIKYTNIWWKIEITLLSDKLIIKDNGIWISAENKERIFDRFFMWDVCRNNQWHGIWLSLVKKIAEIYNWKIRLNSELWKGSEFIINF